MRKQINPTHLILKQTVSTPIFPFQREGSQCTGVLVGPNLVLTASHCIDAENDDSTSVAVNGQVYSEGSTFVGVFSSNNGTDWDCHPPLFNTCHYNFEYVRFKGSGSSNDLAMLYSDKHLMNNPQFSAIHTNPTNFLGMWFGAWGPDLNTMNTALVQYQSGGPNAWKVATDHEGIAHWGDSGGPLYMNDATTPDGRLVGVLSNGQRVANGMLFFYRFTDTTIAWLNWIVNHRDAGSQPNCLDRGVGSQKVWECFWGEHT